MAETLAAIYPDAVEELLRYIPQKERDSYDAADFAGPDRSFPITSQAQLDAAAHLIGHAADPAAVKAKAIAIAKRKGFKLPDAWKDKDDKGERAMPQPTELDLYLPISRIDKEKREVVVTATAERLDGHQTVIGFDGSQEAFSKWRGNIREMHDPQKAVGRAVTINPIPEQKEVEVTLRVSRGAEDTWQKVLDGTLTGASIGARNGKWAKRIVDGKEVPFLERYDLVELSLVDNPSCPGCDIKIVRNGEITEVLDDAEEEAPEVERAGKQISAATGGKVHEAIGHALMAARSLMQTHADSGCADCKAALKHLDPDGDGDIDAYSGKYGDTDGDADDMEEKESRAIEAEIQRHMSPLIQRMNAVLSTHAARPAIQPTTQSPTNEETITRHIEAMESRYESKLSEVRALLSDVKGIAEKIAATPLPDNLVRTPVPVDKRLATSPQQGYSQSDDLAVINRAKELGLLNTQDSQVAAAARMIALQNPGR